MIREYAGNLIDINAIVAISDILIYGEDDICSFEIYLAGLSVKIDGNYEYVRGVRDQVVRDWRKAKEQTGGGE